MIQWQSLDESLHQVMGEAGNRLAAAKLLSGSVWAADRSVWSTSAIDYPFGTSSLNLQNTAKRLISCSLTGIKPRLQMNSQKNKTNDGNDN